ncbi:hypothetical protein IFM89_026534 [Coptis chinensis]|uniref:Uncharacterized protein n=1 Tax=Coptis chinensis TaxID=261450 RepID=A0A835IX70_9MAGN|nr:hypothetical protein IFM89_026534 [Coptis chinensis]
MGRPHLLAVPYPAQGHVMPLMELAHNLVDHGFKITFVNTEFSHKRIMAALSNNGYDEDFIHLVSIPDGMEERDDRNDLGKLCDAMVAQRMSIRKAAVWPASAGFAAVALHIPKLIEDGIVGEDGVFLKPNDPPISNNAGHEYIPILFGYAWAIEDYRKPSSR